MGNRAPTMDDLEAMPWLDQVLRESMRIYRTAFAVTRRAEVDTTMRR